MGKVQGTWVKVGPDFVALMAAGTNQAVEVYECDPKFKGGGGVFPLIPEFWERMQNTQDSWDVPGNVVFEPNGERPELYIPPQLDVIHSGHPSGLDPADFSGNGHMDRAIRWMLTHPNQAKKYIPSYRPEFELFTGQNEINIVYIQSCTYDGKYQKRRDNHFDDCLLVFSWVNGKPEVWLSAQATVDYGDTWYHKRGNPQGTAQILLDAQFQSWKEGPHKGYTALRQYRDVAVARDFNRDRRRKGDKVFVGVFYVNQHHARSTSYYDVGPFSAGCPVTRDQGNFGKLMTLFRRTPWYLADRGYVVNSTFLTADIFSNDLNPPAKK